MPGPFGIPRVVAWPAWILVGVVLVAACTDIAPRPGSQSTPAALGPATKATPEVEAAVDAAAERDFQATPPAAGTLHQEYLPTVMMRGDRAERTVRLRLRDRAGTWERWWLQRQTFAREGTGWRKVDSADTLLYDGKPLFDQQHARYGGTFMIAPGQVVQLAWQAGVLLARFPDGSMRQVFLASSTDEAQGPGVDGHLRFTLSDDGRPATVALVRNGQEVWRAARSAPE